MKFLLDTHALLWTTFDSAKLSDEVIELVENNETKVFASSISLWEISIKYSIGKLSLNISPEALLGMIEKVGIEIINPSVQEYSTCINLPTSTTHKDPFDRMLIWQSIRNDMVLISKDRDFVEYKKFGLKLMW